SRWRCALHSHGRTRQIPRVASPLVVRGLLSLLACAVVGLASTAAFAAPGPLPSHALIMGIIGATETFGPEGSTAIADIRRSGMTTVVTPISWPSIAPRSAPEAMNPADPRDPHY